MENGCKKGIVVLWFVYATVFIISGCATTPAEFLDTKTGMNLSDIPNSKTLSLCSNTNNCKPQGMDWRSAIEINGIDLTLSNDDFKNGDLGLSGKIFDSYILQGSIQEKTLFGHSESIFRCLSMSTKPTSLFPSNINRNLMSISLKNSIAENIATKAALQFESILKAKEVAPAVSAQFISKFKSEFIKNINSTQNGDAELIFTTLELMGTGVPFNWQTINNKLAVDPSFAQCREIASRNNVQLIVGIAGWVVKKSEFEIMNISNSSYNSAVEAGLGVIGDPIVKKSIQDASLDFSAQWLRKVNKDYTVDLKTKQAFPQFYPIWVKAYDFPK